MLSPGSEDLDAKQKKCKELHKQKYKKNEFSKTHPGRVEMNWQLQYVIAFITLSQQVHGENAVLAHRLLRAEYGVSSRRME